MQDSTGGRGEKWKKKAINSTSKESIQIHLLRKGTCGDGKAIVIGCSGKEEQGPPDRLWFIEVDVECI